MGFLQDIFSDPSKALGHDLTGGNSLVAKTGNSIETVLNNPKTLIETAIATALLGPAGLDIGSLVGAAGSAASAAALGGSVGGLVSAINGGNPITGALLGGVGGVAASYVSGLATTAGAGGIASSAAGSAAAGATVALMTGTDPITGAATGGILGAVTSKVMQDNGGVKYSFDDGSNLTLDSNGKIVSAVDSSGTAVPTANIQKANQAPVEDAHMVQTQAAQDILKMAHATGNPGDDYNALLKAGFTPDQITGTLGEETAGPMSQAAFQQNSGIGKILNDPNISISDKVAQLQAAGYTQDQVGNVGGATYGSDIINQAFDQYGTQPVSADVAQQMKSDWTGLSNTNANKADIYNQMLSKGYTQQELNGVFGSDNVTQYADAATSQNGTIGEAVKGMQTAGQSIDQMATTLKGMGYNANQVINALGTEGSQNADTITKAFANVGGTSTTSPTGPSAPGGGTTTEGPTGPVAPGGTTNPPIALGNEDADQIAKIVSDAQAQHMTAAQMAEQLKTAGYTAEQVIQVVGQDNATLVQNAYQEMTDKAGGKLSMSTLNADGTTTYKYDDGSSLTVDKTGTPIHSTEAPPGNLPGGTPPGTSGTSGSGTSGPSGPGASGPTTPGNGTPVTITPVITPVPPVDTGPKTPTATTPSTSYTPAKMGPIPVINSVGANPGWMGQAVKPMYNATSPDQAQYYWGAHPYAGPDSTLANYNYNAVPNAPSTPWGAATSAVGGTQYLNIPAFTANLLGLPNSQATALGVPVNGGNPIGPIAPTK